MEILSIIKIFLLSMIPLGERISIPIGLILYKLDPVTVFVSSFLGNMVAVFILLWFLEPVSNFLSKNFKIFSRFFNWLFTKTRTEYAQRLEKYGLYSLAIFTAIPLPFNGGWTASLIAFIFGIPAKKALIFISVGLFISGLIILFVTQAGFSVHSYYGWQILTLFLLIFFISFFFYKKYLEFKK